LETSARYVLKGALSYASRDGEMAEAQFLEMNAPTGKHARQVASLRQAIVRAIVEDGRTNPAPEPAESPVPAPEPSGDEGTGAPEIAEGIDIINILARSSVDLGDVYKVARDLFVLKGVIRVDGEVPMTTVLLDAMSAQDFETLVGSYIANFTLPS